jgi:hypothetical protein
MVMKRMVKNLSFDFKFEVSILHYYETDFHSKMYLRIVCFDPSDEDSVEIQGGSSDRGEHIPLV